MNRRQVTLSDFVKYGIIILTAGIQIGIFYEVKNTVEKNDKELIEVKKTLSAHAMDIKILKVRFDDRESK